MIQTEDLPVIPLPDVSEKGKSAFEALKGLGFDDAISSIANGIVQFSFKLLIAVLVFYIGKFILKKIYDVVFKIMVNNKVEASLTTFVLSVIRIVLYFILIVTVIGILGIETSSFLALFASAGVAIGMALSGTLQNFAGGVLILLLKPYKVGDYIEAQGYAGTVKEIQIFHTLINTVDNKSIIIPNGGLSTGSINNYSKEDYRRVDWKIGLSYGTDYQEASDFIMSMISEDPRVVKEYVDDHKIAYRKYLKQIASESEPDCDDDDGQSQNPNGGDDDCPDTEAQITDNKNIGWWRRMRLRHRAKKDLMQEKLKSQMTINEGLPIRKKCPPFVGLNDLADSSIVLVVRAWTPASEYWNLFFDMNERFYKELPEHGFSFPFPQMDIHVTDVPEGLLKK